MADLTQVLRERGTPVCAQVVREITRSAGWRWRRARKVLTSTDPEYRAKVHHIRSILAELQENEAFFSIDKFGPSFDPEVPINSDGTAVTNGRYYPQQRVINIGATITL